MFGWVQVRANAVTLGEPGEIDEREHLDLSLNIKYRSVMNESVSRFRPPVDLYIKHRLLSFFNVQHLSQNCSSEFIYGDIGVLHVSASQISPKHFVPALRYDDRHFQL